MHEQEIKKEKAIEKLLQKFKSGLEDMCTVTIWKKGCRAVSKKVSQSKSCFEKTISWRIIEDYQSCW